ncbi:MAG TPA: saccharopine dehydrogenase NADP-binding domain-containing protein [Streptosporangiaceae bacterium]|nr:saccharopine dehydrogenase NADP-binding domain-containing protein [Streptosporangiaceae bacterium]
MPEHATYHGDGTQATSQSVSWMLYGAAGYTGTLIAEHARQRGHQPVLAGRSAPGVTALAERLGLPCRELSLDDPAALTAALAGVPLVLNAAGPFLHTAGPLAEACVRAGAHYLDIGNELQVFRALYDLDERARQAGITIMPGAGFGVVVGSSPTRPTSMVFITFDGTPRQDSSLGVVPGHRHCQ